VVSKTELRKGFTTGTCAAAAAKAAAMALKESEVRSQESSALVVEIALPEGKRVSLAALIKEVGKDYAIASVIKDAGDDPDVTDGAEIVAKVKRKSEDGCQKSEEKQQIVIKGGKGVGVVTKPGLQIPVGEHAINPVPRRMIKEAVKEVLGDRPVEVTIEVPEGEKLAERTFNPRLGIVGGISIIGTTGIVEPMSLDALKATVQCEIDIAVEELKSNSKLNTQHSTLFFAPGKIGEDSLKRVFGNIRVVQTSNFVGFALQYAKEKGIESIVFGGHPGKLAKILMGYYDTHSRNSPQATGFVSDYLGIKGEFNTVEERITYIKAQGLRLKAEGFSLLAGDIAERIARDFGFGYVEIYLFDMKKELIGEGRCVG
jgi:cobalt-precorrin-5B (C1)-methyltransferase